MTGSTQTAPAPPAPAYEEPKSGTGSRQRLFLLAGSGLALVIVAALAYFFLLSGGSDDATGQTLPLPTPKASASPTGAAKPATPALKTFAGQTARNPFKSLAPAAGGTGAGTAASSGTSGSTGTTGTTGSTGSTGSTSATGASLSSVPLVLTLKSVTGTSSASIWVYNKSTKKTGKYSPQIGDTFGKYFRLTGFLTDTKTGEKAALVEYGDTILTLFPGTSSTVQ
jgi:hypothetical protein